MKKLVSILLLLVMAFSLFACNTGGDNKKKAEPNFNVPAGGYDGSEVTIKFYHTMGSNLKTVLDEYVAEFNKLYPNIHVENEQIGSYDDVRDQLST